MEGKIPKLSKNKQFGILADVFIIFMCVYNNNIKYVYYVINNLYDKIYDILFIISNT